MNAIPTRRPPRIVEDTAANVAGERSSVDLRSDLALLDADREANVGRLDHLEATRNEVLLTDDDAKAEAHDTETQRVRRAIERADLKRPGVVEAITSAEERERAEARAQRQAEARSEVNAVLARLTKEYEGPAMAIATFLADWQRVSDLASAAGVDGPDVLAREQAPKLIQEAGEDVYLVYIDEQGRDTDQPYPPGCYDTGPDGQPVVKFRQKQRRTKPRPARYSEGVYLGSLAGRANLPAARVGQPAPWEGGDLALKSDIPEPHVRRFIL